VPTDATLSDAELQALRAAAGAMIPASVELGMPGADDPRILADIVRSVGRDLSAVRAALRSFATGQDVNAWYQAGGAATVALGRVVAGAYYRDDRVLTALGHEARAPFPKGYVLEQGDWSLLESVKRRPAFWRKDR
jgi:hypothetical protein